MGINKPYRMSSFGALAHIRYVLSKHLGYKVKIGHAGTLDPLATGVLILCTGRATKQIEELQKHTKEYTATLQLGATTPSYDMEHPVDQEYPTAHITREQVEEVLKRNNFNDLLGEANICNHIDLALARAREIVAA